MGSSWTLAPAATCRWLFLLRSPSAQKTDSRHGCAVPAAAKIAIASGAFQAGPHTPAADRRRRVQLRDGGRVEGALDWFV